MLNIHNIDLHTYNYHSFNLHIEIGTKITVL